MKISRLLCARYIDGEVPPAAELAAMLTARGFEVESVAPVAQARGVVTGEIVAVHPHTEKSRRCEVNTGADAAAAPRTIICGAANVRPGMKTAVALPGAVIADGRTIQATSIGGVKSDGMLCSAAELGVGEDKSGIVELPASTPNGEDLSAALLLNDDILEVAMTPNRGDGFSHYGVAREVAAAMKASLKPLPPPSDSPSGAPELPLAVAAAARDACPYYGAMMVRGVDCAAPSPLWLQSVIERCGGRSVSAAVDVTNYVMLMSGQPLHAFDADKLNGGITVRYATEGEALTVLDGTAVTMTADTLVIADDSDAVAIAGVMGGKDSGVTEATVNILLEGAFFAPGVVRGKARDYKLNSEAALRFERGVDPRLPPIALPMAAALMTSLCGGEAGGLHSAGAGVDPSPRTVSLPIASLAAVSGMDIPAAEAASILASGGMFPAVSLSGEGEETAVRVEVPSWRFDIAIAEDLIEEVVRGRGYDRIPETMPVVTGGSLRPLPEAPYTAAATRNFFTGRGFLETVNYSFVPAAWEADLSRVAPIALENPMSEDMAVMRTTLYGGLLAAARFNSRHRQKRLRLYEVGTCFFPAAEADALPAQTTFVGGLLSGAVSPPQWSGEGRAIDFYDVKGVVGDYLGDLPVDCRPLADAAACPALHPGQAAEVWHEQTLLGRFGRLHPQLPIAAAFKSPVYLFELNVDVLEPLATRRRYAPVSPLPLIERDLSLLADKSIAVGEVLSAAQQAAAGSAVQSVHLFDFCPGDGKIAAPDKNVCGLRIVMQGRDKNLTGAEINAVTAKICEALKSEYGIIPRQEDS